MPASLSYPSHGKRTQTLLIAWAFLHFATLHPGLPAVSILQQKLLPCLWWFVIAGESTHHLIQQAGLLPFVVTSKLQTANTELQSRLRQVQ